MMLKLFSAALLASGLLLAVGTPVLADVVANETTQAEEVEHRLVIQVSTDDPRTQTIALNNAVNLQKYYGIDNVTIEIVAYGPGLGMLTTSSPALDRITSLAQQEIVFSACGNTIETIESKTGKKPELISGVGVVKAGVARIMELQEQGYSYVRP